MHTALTITLGVVVLLYSIGLYRWTRIQQRMIRIRCYRIVHSFEKVMDLIVLTLFFVSTIFWFAYQNVWIAAIGSAWVFLTALVLLGRYWRIHRNAILRAREFARSGQ